MVLGGFTNTVRVKKKKSQAELCLLTQEEGVSSCPFG